LLTGGGIDPPTRGFSVLDSNSKLSRTAAAKSTPSPARAVGLSPGGPYPGWGTSSLLPGQVGTGSVVVNQDGTIDTVATNGDRTHATINISDPNNVNGSSITHLGKPGGIQRTYPDGSISTQVTIHGRLANGVITGTYYDKFQTGQFQWSVEPGK